ncbi:CHC2 zinc finger domain-containing protein [Gracilimonas sediminicola]|uniref:CHC2 zinc finger domain-containing protein n=1 Tax=Gracilimonas sediminicola TaxID=2952158 RepID=A0A9X2L6F7_9BACT|nr:CHC2 zinc finger domain-containing protein [Gracilimonas sediminicola]MCP9292458.1 CHC2 zinc finger domain-containing protein [Gracilimonas sediminicola]
MTFYEAIPHVREASRNDIIEIISERISLKKSGSYYKACCPFHSEKTPSFYVHENKGTYKCFGCQAWGDAISFVEFFDGLTFTEVIYLLADRYHLTISHKSRKKSQQAVKKEDDTLPGYSSVKSEILKTGKVYIAFKQGIAPFTPLLFIDGQLSLEAAKLLRKRAQKIIFVAQGTSWKILKPSFEAALKAELEVFAIPDYSKEFQEMDWVDYCSAQTTQKITNKDVIQLIAGIPDNITRSVYITYATDNFKELTT